MACLELGFALKHGFQVVDRGSAILKVGVAHDASVQGHRGKNTLNNHF